MDELEKVKMDYEGLKNNYEVMCENYRRTENECINLKRENDRLWKLVENLSIALKGGNRQ